MKKLLNTIFLTIFFLVILSVNSIACSQYYEPKSKFESELYIFIGEVIGYTDEFKSKNILNKSYGLKVKVLESVNLPRNSNDYFEIFPFDISSDCAKTIGIDDKSLQKFYPVNSKVLVAAEFWKISDKNKSGQIVLTIDNAFNNKRLFINDLEKTSVVTTDSIFDYKNWDDNYSLSRFELWKDLKRLEVSSSDEEKIKIFERLIYLPKDWINFEATVQNYVKNSETRQTLINKRKNLE
jgi:hypothetical protein